MRITGLATLTLLLGATLVGCSDDEPAVCSSVDDLKASVEDVTNIEVTASGAASELQSGLTTIKSDLADVKSDAESEFSPEVDAVESAFATLTTTVDAAAADPTADTLAAAGAAVSPFSSAVQTLVDDVKSTC
jgi:hypothetical protein